MKNIFKQSLNAKLILLFMLVSMSSLTAAFVISYFSSADTISTRMINQLSSVAHDRSLALDQINTLKIHQLKAYMANNEIQNLVEISNTGTALTQDQMNKIGDDMAQLGPSTGDNESGFHNALIMNKNGLAIWAYDSSHLGDDMSQDLHFDEAMQGGGRHYERVNGERVAVTDAGIYGSTDLQMESPIGAIISTTDVSQLDNTLLDHNGLGDTGETYIVGVDRKMMSESRFQKGSEFNQSVDTLPVKECFENGKDVSQQYTNYRGETVFGVSICPSSLEYVLVAEISQTEMNSAITALQNLYITVGGIISVLVGALAFFISRSISRPITKTAMIAKKISEGDLTVEIESTNSQDEIGNLTNSFKNMVTNLRTMVHKVKESAVTVAANTHQVASSTEQMSLSVQQISSTIQQISKGTHIQATELDETSKTVETLNQNMRELASRTDVAYNLAKEVGQISDRGSMAASEAENRMMKIISVTDKSVKKIRDLAERSSQIPVMLDVIQKIADQTNLLALNAAIEAARAGEAGKGFSVVADEVKRLAEESTKSSKVIGLLIKQIQMDANSTVQSIESNAKEVAEGKQVIGAALQALEDIANKVKEVSSTVMDVTNTTKNQVSEIERVSRSSSEIAAVSEENASATEEASSSIEEQTAGTQEIASSVQQMAGMADNLSQIVSKFRLPKNYQTLS